MALFLIERHFAERLGDLTADGVRQADEVNDEYGIEWLFSFMSADRKKTYCLYEATNSDVLREHARVLGIPADEIIEVTHLSPEKFRESGAGQGHKASG